MSIKFVILFAILACVSAGHLESPLQVPYYTTTPASYGSPISYANHHTYAGLPALSYGHNSYVPTLPYGHSYGYPSYGHSVAPLTTYPTTLVAPRGYGYSNHVSHGTPYGHYAY